jgi:hypothetical protein
MAEENLQPRENSWARLFVIREGNHVRLSAKLHVFIAASVRSPSALLTPGPVLVQPKGQGSRRTPGFFVGKDRVISKSVAAWQRHDGVGVRPDET